MKQFLTMLLLLVLLCPSGTGGEPRLKAPPAPDKPSDLWSELKPVAKVRPVKPAAKVASDQVPSWQTRYTLGPGDVLNFSVYNQPELSRENVTIAPDGTVSYLQAVAVRAQGLTPDQLRNRLQEELTKYKKDIKVIISPTEVASKTFSIIGRVNRPGSYVLDRPTSILEAIALAEGIQIGSVRGSAYELADFERSFVARGGKKLGVDLAKLYYQGDFSQNAYLEPQDYIYVASNADREVYVVGEVTSPGRIKMPHELTLVKAIAEAGGFTESAFRKHVLLVRGSIHQPETTVVDVMDILQGRKADVPLSNKDIIFVNTHPLDVVGKALDSAIVTFMQTVAAQSLNDGYNPVLLRD